MGLHIKRIRRPIINIAVAATALFGSIASLSIAYSTGSHTAEAATPPDTCFAFSAGTITGYYAEENDDPGQPACPKNVDIPSTISSMPVTTIGNAAFAGRQLSAITLPASLTTIGDWVFAGNPDLTSLSIPNSVTTLGSGITAGSSVTTLSIGTSDFSGTPTLAIPANAFNSTGLVSLTLGNNVVSIGDSAFRFNALSSITIPSSVASIADGAFSNNLLASVVFNEGLTSIGADAFSSNSLTSLVLADSLKTIGYMAFAFNDLITVDLASIETIDNGAFAFNGTFASVVIPTTVTSLGAPLFQGSSIHSLTIGTADHTGLPMLDIPDGAFQDLSINELHLYSTVRSIGAGAFVGNNITTVALPDVQTIGNTPFGGNPLASATIGTVDYDGPALLDVPRLTSSSITELHLGKVVRSIQDGAFASQQLTSVTFPDSIISIGASAFENNQLTSIVIPDSVTSIGNDAFRANFDGADPHSLTVTIGSGVQTIGEHAFGSNPTLDELYISGDPVLADSVFDYSGGLCGGTELARCYIRIYATNPDFVATYAPGRLVTVTGGDNAQYMLTGYIINPATYAVNYEASTGETLAPSLASGVGSTITDYSFVANQTGDFSLYYHTGSAIPLTALAIDGYTTPASHSLILGPGSNLYTFSYVPISQDTDNNSGGNSSGTVASSSAEAATSLSATGTNQWLMAGTGLLVALTGIYLGALSQRREIKKDNYTV